MFEHTGLNDRANTYEKPLNKKKLSSFELDRYMCPGAFDNAEE